MRQPSKKTEAPRGRLNPPGRDFVERLGLHMEREGLSRSAGRIGGYLMLQDEPRSLEEIAEALHLSRGSVSTNARFLERAGVAERVGFPGDRRDYYRTVPDFPGAMMKVWRQRLEEMTDLLERTLDELPEKEEPGRARVGRMLEFYRALDTQLEQLDHWWAHEPQEEPDPS